MKKKLNLDLAGIEVSSFETDEYENVRGTVAGNEDGRITQWHCGGTVMIGQVAVDDCTSGCVCCRFRPARLPKA